MKIKYFPFFVVLTLIFQGCQDKFNPKKEIITSCKQGSETVHKILFVGWDGTRTDALLAANTPEVDSLLQHAYYNLHTDRGTYTVSVPGWSTILHGVWPEKHGLTENSFIGSHYDTYPDIFTLAKRVKPNLSVANLSNWDDFLRITDNEDFAQRYDSDTEMKEGTIQLIESCTPDIIVLHFNNPDEFGHDSGFSPDNPKYLQAIEISDMYLGNIMKVIRKREALTNEKWLVVMTTDHGGHGTGHGGQYDLPETRFVWSILRTPDKLTGEELPLVNSVDLLPTMLNWIGITVDPAWNLDGEVLF